MKKKIFFLFVLLSLSESLYSDEISECMEKNGMVWDTVEWKCFPADKYIVYPTKKSSTQHKNKEKKSTKDNT